MSNFVDNNASNISTQVLRVYYFKLLRAGQRCTRIKHHVLKLGQHGTEKFVEHIRPCYFKTIVSTQRLVTLLKLLLVSC